MVNYIIIGVILFCIVISIGYSIKRKKAGQSSCGSSCGGCPSAESCSPEGKK